jgi:hypothetical protein
LNLSGRRQTKKWPPLVKKITNGAVFLPYTSRNFFRAGAAGATDTALSGDMKEVIMTGARNY